MTDPTPEFLAAEFGLRTSEAMTAAAIVAGKCRKTCARERGITAATIKTQLHVVFIKSGATTQSALTAMAWRAWSARGLTGR